MTQPHTLTVHSRVNTGPLENRDGLDLQTVDFYRERAKRDLAHLLAEELLKSGAVKITERLRHEPSYGGGYVQVTMELKVAA
jgi:hypothetical protein